MDQLVKNCSFCQGKGYIEATDILGTKYAARICPSLACKSAETIHNNMMESMKRIRENDALGYKADIKRDHKQWKEDFEQDEARDTLESNGKSNTQVHKGFRESGS